MHSVLTPEHALGPAQRVELSAGTVEHHECGRGRPVLFVRGLMVHAALWRTVVPALADRYRCIVPTLPLGSHRLPMGAQADLSPTGIADLLAELLDTLHLRDAVVVGNDTGGAYAQMLAARHPDHVAGLVLTPCDALEHFWPWHPARLLRQSPVPRSVLSHHLLSRHGIPDEVLASYLAPLRQHGEVRRDLTKVLADIHPRHTRTAARLLRDFAEPVLLAWDAHDPLFPLRDARHLAALLPDAQLQVVPDSGSYIPEDQPDRLAALIDDFITGRVEERGGT